LKPCLRLPPPALLQAEDVWLAEDGGRLTPPLPMRARTKSVFATIL